jgi:signal peptidase I
MGISRNDAGAYFNQQTGEYLMPLTAVNFEKIRTMGNVVDINEVESGGEAFPQDGRGWTGSDFGPLWIPSKGATIALTLDNLPLYERIIDVYEDNDLEVRYNAGGVGVDDGIVDGVDRNVDRGGVIYINGVAASEYTFKMDYYWMMGDNRQNSADSRFWGFVPEDHIVGKASFVWLSLDKERGLFDGKIRWSKMFRKIR